MYRFDIPTTLTNLSDYLLSDFMNLSSLLIAKMAGFKVLLEKDKSMVVDKSLAKVYRFDFLLILVQFHYFLPTLFSLGNENCKLIQKRAQRKQN